MLTMIKRTLEKTIASRLRAFPAVALLGPRQVGKTTLAPTFSSTYFDLELEEERLKLDIQWDALTRSKELIVLDEAQNFPELFPRMSSAIDQERSRMGRFLILGSVSPGLMKEVSEFLTGRLAICERLPFRFSNSGRARRRRSGSGGDIRMAESGKRKISLFGKPATWICWP